MAVRVVRRTFQNDAWSEERLPKAYTDEVEAQKAITVARQQWAKDNPGAEHPYRYAIVPS